MTTITYHSLPILTQLIQQYLNNHNIRTQNNHLDYLDIYPTPPHTYKPRAYTAFLQTHDNIITLVLYDYSRKTTTHQFEPNNPNSLDQLLKTIQNHLKQP